ncbi:hypothetical protein PO909_029173 [Leuciscus waleckii]
MARRVPTVHHRQGTVLPQKQFFCAPHGDSAVRSRWVSHAVHTHTRHKAQLRRVLQHRRYSECKHALHTHTILVLSVVAGVRWPFLWHLNPLSLSLSVSQ